MKKIVSLILPFLLLSSVLVWAHVSRLSHGDLVVNFLDIGQGDSILVQTPNNHLILIDGGPGTAILTELNDVLPFLQKKIDLLVLTHPHSDHIEGLVPVIKKYDIDEALITGVDYTNSYYDEFLKDLRGEARTYFAYAGTDFEFDDGVFVDVLYPFEPIVGDEVENLNNSSIVIRLVYGENEILFMGDAEIEVEQELIESGVFLQSDVLKTGHHGSRTATNDEFLEEVAPLIAVIQVGEGNSFGHPHQETLDKLSGVDVYRNDLDGRITLRFRE